MSVIPLIKKKYVYKEMDVYRFEFIKQPHKERKCTTRTATDPHRNDMQIPKKKKKRNNNNNNTQKKRKIDSTFT